MDSDLNLNTSGNLPDRTAKANRPEPGAHADVTAADLERGYTVPETKPIGTFDADASGGENQVGNPFTQGGFLGRPRGWAR